MLRGGMELKKISRKPFSGFLSPFLSTENVPVIIHCCYHKIGTVWFERVLRDVAAEYGISYGTGSNYQNIHRFETTRNCGVFVDYGSHVKLDKLGNYVGSHMIRDPRDVVISGYFYHLWTTEKWANLPMVEFGAMSYREYLNNLDQDEGLLAEIRRLWFWIPHMLNWNYSNPRIYEIKYEDIIANESKVFREMFKHYGFHDKAVDRCCRLAEKYTFKKLTDDKSGKKKKSHLRSGKTGEWKNIFNNEHKKLFKELYPRAVPALGYEKDDNW